MLASPSFASAHLKLLSPIPRYEDDGRKTGPCGNEPRGLNVTIVPPGSRLRVQWQETIDHQSHYRIAFDADGEDELVDPPSMQDYYSNDAVLVDAIADEGGIMTADVDLPDIECENCTLQVIQVMYDKQPYTVPGNDIYYTCADLVLRRDAPCEGERADGGQGPCVVNMGPDGGVDGSPPDGGTSGASDGDEGTDEGGSEDTSGSTGGGGYMAGGGSGAPPPVETRSGCSAGAAYDRESVRSLFFVALALGALVRTRRSRF